MFLFAIYRDPWLSLPFEALEIVTIHLMGVAFSLFCASAAPVGLLATLQGTPDNINFFSIVLNLNLSRNGWSYALLNWYFLVLNFSNQNFEIKI